MTTRRKSYATGFNDGIEFERARITMETINNLTKHNEHDAEFRLLEEMVDRESLQWEQYDSLENSISINPLTGCRERRG